MTVTDVDASLLRAVSAGDEAALNALYERHATWLYVRLLRRCNDGDLVADVVQDTFLAVWRGGKNRPGTLRCKPALNGFAITVTDRWPAAETH